MTDTPIRTSWETLNGDPVACEQAWAYLPSDWPDDIESVLVVAGLPEGAELRRLCDVPEGWEWFTMGGKWKPAHPADTIPRYVGYVLARPKPEPAPPATERVMWHEAIGRRLPGGYQLGRVQHGSATISLDKPEVGSWTAVADEDGMVTVLVDPAPTGDDEPRADTPGPLVWARPNDVGPRLESEWTSESHRTITVRVDRPDDYHTVALVRRDGTDPTPDLTPLFAALDAHESAVGSTARNEARLAMAREIRALRDGGAR